MASSDDELVEAPENSSHYRGDAVMPISFPDVVRRRPGMFIGDTESADGVKHFALELIDNAIDEHIRGFADCIDVVVDEEHVEVSDNGRGLDIRTDGRDVFTSLLGSSHQRGPHKPKRGIGLAVISALSDLLVVEISRGGRSLRHGYARGIEIAPPVDAGPSSSTGTRISAAPDPSIFATRLDAGAIEERLRDLSYLTPGANLSMNGKYLPRGTLSAWCTELAGSDTLIAPPFHVQLRIGDVDVDIACAWSAHTRGGVLRSFVNTRRTRDDGTHVAGFFQGFKAGLAAATPLRSATFRSIMSRGLVAVVHVRVPLPRFGSPTRARLENPEARHAVRNAVVNAVPAYFAEHPDALRALVDKIATRPRRATR
jgi:DNA gyrase subunit B